MQEGSAMYNATKRSLDKLLMEKEANQTKEENNQENTGFSDDTINKIRGMVDPATLNPLMGKTDNQIQDSISIVKYQNDNQKDDQKQNKIPENIEYIPIDNIPADAVQTNIEEPKPSLLNRAKEWIKSNKGKTAMIIGAAVVLGIAIGAAVHYITTGDSSAMQNVSQADLGTLASQISAQVDAEVASRAAEAASNAATTVDTSSITDLLTEAH